MTETTRSFAVGDDVISTVCLVAPPTEPPGVNLEIPLACRGRVVDVRPYDYPKPYVVEFEIGEGGHVEIDVTSAQVARVQAREPVMELPPLIVREPRRHVRLYRPTKAHPHRCCRAWHKANNLSLCAAYGSALSLYTVSALIVTSVVVLGMYYHHFRTHRSWALIPDVLLPDAPEIGERYIFSDRWMRWVPVVDASLFAIMLVFLAVHFTITVNPSRGLLVPYFVITGMALVAWLTKLVIHERSVRIVPDCAN